MKVTQQILDSKTKEIIFQTRKILSLLKNWKKAEDVTNSLQNTEKVNSYTNTKY